MRWKGGGARGDEGVGEERRGTAGGIILAKHEDLHSRRN